MQVTTPQEQPSKHNVIVAAALQTQGKLSRKESRDDKRGQEGRYWPEDLNCVA
jgi:hypothetical protein